MSRGKGKYASTGNFSMMFQILIYPRFILSWSILFIVGIGSFLFHGTLQRWAQACDEVPMVIANAVYLFSLICSRKACMSKEEWMEEINKYRAFEEQTSLIQESEGSQNLLPVELVSATLSHEESLWESKYYVQKIAFTILVLAKVRQMDTH